MYNSLDRPPSSHDSLNTTSLGTSVFPDSCTSLEAPELLDGHAPPRGCGNLPRPPPVDYYHHPQNGLINPSDYHCYINFRQPPPPLQTTDKGWRSLADQVSDGTYNLSPPATNAVTLGALGRNAMPIAAGPITKSLGLPRVHDYPSSDHEDYR